jgi:hypothetical protein
MKSVDGLPSRRPCTPAEYPGRFGRGLALPRMRIVMRHRTWLVCVRSSFLLRISQGTACIYERGATLWFWIAPRHPRARTWLTMAVWVGPRFAFAARVMDRWSLKAAAVTSSPRRTGMQCMSNVWAPARSKVVWLI